MSEMDCTQWHPYFAWWPVTVDAYTESERKDGKSSYPKLGWVERRMDIFIENYGLEEDVGVTQRVWRFRLPRTDTSGEPGK